MIKLLIKADINQEVNHIIILLIIHRLKKVSYNKMINFKIFSNIKDLSLIKIIMNIHLKMNKKPNSDKV
jgi:hypothetical protein